jgi:NADPH:quinone reductase-like Zn-dependent oxidoreductase
MVKALLQTGYGAPQDVLKLGSLDVPTPPPGCVRVRVRAVSLNTPDWIATLGSPRLLRLVYGLGRPRQPVRGTDVAGVVDAVGEGVTDLAPGDAVFGSTWNGGPDTTVGSLAELTIAPAAHLAKKPEALSWAEAAGLGMSAVVAQQAIVDVGQVQAGQAVLIIGASGGIGTFAVQLARARGARVVGVCSGKNAALVERLGAHRVIDYTEQDPLTDPERFDLVLDNVLVAPPRRSLVLLSPGGRLIPNSVGRGDWVGGVPTMIWTALFHKQRCPTIDHAPTRDRLEALAALVASGALEVVVDSERPLAEAPAAVAHMASHRAVGQVVVTV